MPVATRDAYRLMHEGTLAFAEIERNGIRIDVPLLKKNLGLVAQEIQLAEEELKASSVWDAWKLRYRSESNLGSEHQLGEVFFNILQYPCHTRTATGKPSTNDAAMSEIDHPFIATYMRKKRLAKLHSTYLQGILREVEGEFLHPSFNLNQTRTFRSACQAPNFQNIPIRNKEISKWIRSAFIPRPGRMLLEVDYGQIEVRVAACHHKDPTMLRYIEENYDMHFDMAKELFRLTDDQVTGPIRHTAKNGFVFASFYGDYYLSIAQNIWQMIAKNDLKLADGTALFDHLHDKGITKLGLCEYGSDPVQGTFEHHMQRVEKRFWEKRFPVYNRWRQKQWEKYCERGAFYTKTGFLIQGILKRNQVVNASIQGCAFHCLLWSTIQLVKRELKRHKFKTLIVGQIHDSLLLDIPREEVDDVLPLIKRVMTEDIRKAWPWIITRLDVDAAGSYQNWFAKEEVPL